MRRASIALAFITALAVSAPHALAKKDGDKPAVKLEAIKLQGAGAKAPRTDDTEIGLTVDPTLQKAVDKLLDASKAPSGAVLVSDVKTGRILAWATRGKEGDMGRKAKYPGASLFKIVTTAALLESEKVHLGDTVCFKGGESKLVASDIKPGCRSDDSRTRFENALGRSLNVVFGRLAVQHLDDKRLAKMATAFGIGEAPPFDLPADKTSIKIPSDELGLARAAAGFGDARMSPLAALDMMTTIANGGERIRLHITGSPDKVPRVSLGQTLKKETARDLLKMLEVTTRSGTSAKAFEPKPDRPHLSVAGKTGTLMTQSPKRLVSWFAGFAPSRDPEIVVSVLLANDETWWRKGNEVARDVFDAYFERKAKTDKKR
ncbi:MAG: penicillin-binding protein [Polyangiaceae bacterium]|jgi:peptidoglycan glycosyltransferase|nr:penicillin-binding protein [Polyangiaceae bacterium]MBK8941485.1 penicillin-binding protein [Polyangiaceae bacterium]